MRQRRQHGGVRVPLAPPETRSAMLSSEGSAASSAVDPATLNNAQPAHRVQQCSSEHSPASAARGKPSKDLRPR